jgi:hypothetical protein
VDHTTSPNSSKPLRAGGISPSVAVSKHATNPSGIIRLDLKSGGGGDPILVNVSDSAEYEVPQKTTRGVSESKMWKDFNSHFAKKNRDRGVKVNHHDFLELPNLSSSINGRFTKLSKSNTRNFYSNNSTMTRRCNIRTLCRILSPSSSGTPRQAPPPQPSRSSSISGSKVRPPPSMWWSRQPPWKRIIPTLCRNT